MQTAPEPSATLAPAPEPTPDPQHTALAEPPLDTRHPTLDPLISPQPTLTLQPSSTLDLGLQTLDSPPPPTVIDAKPLVPALQPHKARRKGRVASLPKLQRDTVNRMLWNGVPYKNIVGALDEIGF